VTSQTILAVTMASRRGRDEGIAFELRDVLMAAEETLIVRLVGSAAVDPSRIDGAGDSGTP
jgi:hypothetical protein